MKKSPLSHRKLFSQHMFRLVKDIYLQPQRIMCILLRSIHKYRK